MSESRQPKRDYIFGPRQAFQFVGKHCFDDDWEAKCIEDPAQPQHKTVLAELRDALKSGKVAAQWDTLDFRQTGDLHPLDVDGEFFQFMLKEDLVFHPRLNEPVRCRISALDLGRRECLKLCVSDRVHAVFRYVQASKRPVNIMAS
jgi:hypothetical protein